jgi:hypothetical protein
VAVQTIYDTFGSKAAVLRGLPDLIDEEVGVFEIVEQIEAAKAPDELLALYAHLERQIRERCGDIMRILRAGAASDARTAEAFAEGLSRRRFGMTRVIGRIAATGRLKQELTPERATDIALAIICDEIGDVLVDQGRWSFDEYESWMAATLALLLLRDPRQITLQAG